MDDTDTDISPSKTGDSDRPDMTPTAPFFGYRPFPSVMNLYGNFSGVLSALTTHKLCGAAESDFLYLAEIHFGYTPRGPLNFGRGYYLRNGTSTKAPILAAAGDEFRLPFLVALFDTKTAVMLPPLDLDKNPTNKVTETLRSMTSKEHGVTFRFAIEVGMKRLQREEFEWRKMVGKQDGDDGSLKGSRYTLVRLAPDFPVASSSKALSPDLADEDCETVAELAFGNIMSIKHILGWNSRGRVLLGNWESVGL